MVDADTSLLVTGSSEDGRTIVSLRLKRIYRTGAGVYQLRRGSVVNGYSSANILLGGSTGASYSTLYGPSATNGSVTVSQYDRAAQKASGTFSYTAGAIPNTPAAGAQGVTSGSFTFTRFQ